MKRASLVSRESDTLQVYYAEAKAPFPYKNRDGVYLNIFRWDPDERILRVEIEMPEEMTGTLGIGSDDGVKVWLNGELVHENWLSREVAPDDDRVPVTFRKGKNQLVLKVQNALGAWGFCCRLLDE